MAVDHNRSPSPLSSRSSEQLLSEDDLTDKVAPQLATQTLSTLTRVEMEEVPLVLESQAQDSAQDSGLPAQSDNQAISAARVAKGQSSPLSPRSVPKLNTRAGSISRPLPWSIDETSSPCTPTHSRSTSFVPPPPRTYYRASVDTSPKMPPLQTSVASPASQNSYNPSAPYLAPSPSFSTTSSTSSRQSQAGSLCHPPGYTQDFHSSFSDSVKSPYQDNTPFYAVNQSYSSTLASPMTPTRRGRGILDNDPAIYLAGLGDVDEDSMWDTAAKWAKAVSKRLSSGEQTVWKMVGAVAKADEEK